jgi:hypothetical protein
MSKTNCTLSQEYLKSILKYDPDTGIFTWVKHKPQQRKDIPPGFINSGGYHIIKIDLVPYKAHRLAWLYVHGHWPPHFLDHINMVRNDNRICNLRLATSSENGLNRRKFKNNTTGYMGVSYNKNSKKYVSMLMIDGKSTFLGYFDDAKTASDAYNQLKSEMTQFHQPPEHA